MPLSRPCLLSGIAHAVLAAADALYGHILVGIDIQSLRVVFQRDDIVGPQDPRGDCPGLLPCSFKYFWRDGLARQAGHGIGVAPSD